MSNFISKTDATTKLGAILNKWDDLTDRQRRQLLHQLWTKMSLPYRDSNGGKALLEKGVDFLRGREEGAYFKQIAEAVGANTKTEQNKLRAMLRDDPRVGSEEAKELRAFYGHYPLIYWLR